MTIVDYIFILITIIYSIIGLARGFSRQLISFTVWVFFLFVIFNYLSELTDIISSYTTFSLQYNRIIGITTFALLSILTIFILNLTLAKIIASVVFENSNRILGLIMSFVKAQIYILVFVLIILDTSFASDILDESYFAPYYLYLIEYISNYDDSLFNTFQI
tara:strand:+ start:530 stop:1015 length:486 start_codon:yes stop_codon:yes gene_type:complete